jgi:hypothetical protein
VTALHWRKSSYSGEEGGNCVELATQWRKSSRSGDEGGNCVELATQWRKSSRSGEEGGSCVEVALGWRKSTRSGEEGGACVELASDIVTTFVRDSKNPDGPMLGFGRAEMAALFATIRVGALDR